MSNALLLENSDIPNSSTPKTKRRKNNPENGQSVNPGLIDIQGLCERWRVSRMAISRLEKKGKLRRVLLGTRIIRFRLSDIVAIEECGVNS